MDYAVHGILRAGILEWVAFPFPRDLPNPGINPSLPRCRQILYQVSHTGKHVINSKREGARDLASVGSRKWEVLSVYTSLWEAQGPDSLKSGAGSSALTLEIRMLGLLKSHTLGAGPPGG